MGFKLQSSLQVILKAIFIDTLLFVIDLLDMIPELFVSKAKREGKIKRDSQLAKQADPSDHFSPYRTCEFPEPLKISDPNDTIFTEFERAVQRHPDLQTLGVREIFSMADEIQPNGKSFKKFDLGNYKWETYESFRQRTVHLSNGLLSIGMKSKQNAVIFSETRAEWVMFAMSCFRINVPVATLYSTLGIDALKFGIKETGATHVITSSDQLSKFDKIMREIANVTHIIVFGYKFSPKEVQEFKQKHKNVTVVLMEEVEEKGKEVDESFLKFTAPKRDDLAVIMYTSGSTGSPKGVMMSHGNLLASMRSFPIRLGKLTPNKEIWVGYLPLAHVLELTAELGCIMGGIRIGYSSPQTIVDNSTAIRKGQKGDLRVLKPTIMAAVPLILERFSKAVREKIGKTNWFKQALFQRAYEYKLAKVRAGRSSFFLDRILFKKISRAVLGGKVRYIVCGASLLSQDVQEFMQVCLAPVRQAYALTETCAGGTAQYEFEHEVRNCGSVIAAAEIRLTDWEEGGYRVTDKPNPRGEIHIGGDNVTMGYYMNEEKTKEDYHVVDGVRYFATGDIGEMLPNGTLKIIDRKKDLVKLQGGEYISLSKIEVILKILPFVENCCVCANPLKQSCVVLICPNIPKLVEFAKTINVENIDDYKTIVKSNELLRLLYKELESHCLKHGLNRQEIPSKMKLVEEIWMPDTGLVTDSFKLKRKALDVFYARIIDQLYKS